MHIKTGTWEANTVCESDTLCDPAGLVSSTNPEAHIGNRRLSPGSGNCGGGGGGCPTGVDQQPCQASPQALEGNLNGPAHVHAFTYRRDRDRRGQHKGRGPRREGPRGAGRVADRPPKQSQKERWVEDSLSLLKHPPAFPVQDSPAKLQPTISYASKVKSGAVGGVLEEEGRPAIGVLLQNQWGLSFISEVLQATEGSVPSPAPIAAPQLTFGGETANPTQERHHTVQASGEIPVPVTTSISIDQYREEEAKINGKLLLTCHHLKEALHYHTIEWNVTCNKQKEDPNKVVWYKNSLDQPA
ncbi:uncharacterized protein [Oncorhynchus clarkii lewisi]|uniref:uncharacterized protein n=1 Tax=Oncorhynchus clarkii lewisi TaxID=490388 RepID=UPI000B4F9E81